MTDQPAPRPDAPAHGVHVIPEQVPEGVVPPSTSMTPPDTARPDVPDDLVDDAVDAWHDAPRDEHGNRPLLDDLMRHILTAVLPTHTRRVREQVAAEIEAECSGGTEHWAAAMDHAARIARGES